MWWLILWGVAGIVLGCVAVLAVAVIRWLGMCAVRTWRTDDAPAEQVSPDSRAA